MSESAIHHKRKLLAVLYADVEGYGRDIEADEERAHRRISRAIGLFRSLTADYGGHLVNVAGDGVLATFDSASAALHFALEIQREFRNDAVWSADGRPVRFRVGINLGEVIVDPDAVHGHQVNLAERIQRIAPAGGICVSEAVSRAVSPDLRALLRSVGQPALKNTVETVEIFEVDIDSAPAAEPRQPAPEPPPDRPLGATIVVLPFTNVSGDPADGHLCDGLTGELISNLSRFRDLLVIARNSSFAFRTAGVEISDFARLVGARYVLSGGLQRAGSRLRVLARLTEGRQGGRVLWSEHYDGELGDVFAFQDDVTSVITGRLAVQISAAERQRLHRHHTPDLQAYGLVLRGQELSHQFRREATLHARRIFEQAREFDLDYGRPLAGLSRTFNLAWRYQWDPDPAECLKRSNDLAEEAVARDPMDARGHAELGYALLYQKKHVPALAAYEHAIDLNPNDADILAEMGHAVCCAGQAEPAIDYMRRAMRLNPYTPDSYLWFLGEAYFDLGRYEESITTLNRMADRSQAHRLLAASHALLGQLDLARAHAGEVLRLQPDFAIDAWRAVPPDRNEDALDRYCRGLRLAGLR